MLAHAYHRYQGVKGLDNWSNDATGGYDVTVARNKTGAPVTLYDGVLTIPVQYLLLSPDLTGADANVIFEAPSAGTYTVSGNFMGLDSPEGQAAHINIIENGNEYLYGQYARSGVKRRFHFVVPLAAGDTLNFQSAGDNHKNRHDVGLSVKIIGP